MTTTAAVGMAAISTGTAVGYGTAAYAGDHAGRILPSAVVAGIELGGMTPEEAVEAVEVVVAPELEREVQVHWRDRVWTTTPQELGAKTDVEEAVAEAAEASANPSWSDYARMRWLGEELTFAREVTVTHSAEGARAFVDAIAAEVNVAATDATLDSSSGWVEIVPGRDGHVVDTASGGEALYEALTAGQGEVELAEHALAPTVTAADFDQVLLVRQHEHTLHLYQGGEITHEWSVAVGTGDHPTPTGHYEVSLKRHMPTWVNPSPNGWGADLPERIEPGADNPLGVRALNWTAPAIRFHGTANADSIGTDASKGCVRLSNDDVVELYDLVREGAKIVSVRA